MLMRHLIFVTVFAPAAGAFAVAASGAARRARGLAAASTALAFAAALWMWVRFEPRGAEWQFDRHIDLVPSLGLRGIVGVDGFGLSLVLVVTLVAMVCAGWAIGRPIDDRTGSAWIALLAMETGVVGVFVSLDLLQAAVFWAIATTAALRAVGLEAARRRRWLTVVAWFAGIALAGVTIALALRYRALSGFSTFDLRALQTLALAPGAQLGLVAALVPALALPLCILAARIRTTRDREHAASAESIPVMVFLSSLLLPLGLYELVRVGMTILPAGVRLVSPYLIGACAIAALASTVAAIRKTTDFGIVVLSGSVVGCALALAAALTLTPSTIAWGTVLQIGQSVGAAALLLAATALHRAGEAPARHAAGIRSMLVLMPLTIAIAGLALRPAPLLARLETSVARVVLRVSPEYATQVADCLSQPPTPPDPAETGLPAGMVMAAPCADGQGDAHGKK